jgi:hypothetical protein
MLKSNGLPQAGPLCINKVIVFIASWVNDFINEKAVS